MIRSTRPRWPWPGDTPTVRARCIANSLLALLPADERPELIAKARAVGETWLGEDLLRWDVDDLLTPAEAARLVHVTPDRLRWWVHTGALTRTGRRYRAGDVLDAAAQVSRRRTIRKKKAPGDS